MPQKSSVVLVRGLLVLAVSCSDTRAVPDSATPSPVRVARTLPYADTVAIAARVDSIDRYITEHPERLKLFAKLSDKTGLVPVKDRASWPDGTEISYNTVTDIDGRPLFHLQVPTSESGDWDAEEIHYFAPDGHTILHQFRISGFSSGCVEILREIKRTFLAPTGTVLAETRHFSDGAGKPVTAPDSCDRRSDDAPAPKRSAAELPFSPDR
jgi:hypothetical protein